MSIKKITGRTPRGSSELTMYDREDSTDSDFGEKELQVRIPEETTHSVGTIPRPTMRDSGHASFETKEGCPTERPFQGDKPTETLEEWIKGKHAPAQAGDDVAGKGVGFHR
jgi:hypothetical protein